MPRDDEVTIVLHGLDMDNRVVRASIFANKLNTFLAALRAADRLSNDGKSSFDYLLPKLETHSASATGRERRRRHATQLGSSIALFEKAALSVYNGERNTGLLHSPLV